MRTTLACVLLLVVAACRDDAPAGPTREQSAQLNDAEAMLNSLGSNEEGPEQSPGPSNVSD